MPLKREPSGVSNTETISFLNKLFSYCRFISEKSISDRFSNFLKTFFKINWSTSSKLKSVPVTNFRELACGRLGNSVSFTLMPIPNTEHFTLLPSKMISFIFPLIFFLAFNMSFGQFIALADTLNYYHVLYLHNY